MLKYLLILVIAIHGLIHLMGYAKAYGYGNFPQLKKYISKPVGSLWLIAAIHFITTAIFYMLGKEGWWMVAIPALIISQILIIMFWKDAKMGTIANLIILIPFMIAVAGWQMKRNYNAEVKQMLPQPGSKNNSTISQQMLEPLPFVVQKWLRRSGVVGRENIQQVYLQQTGEMMTKQNGNWIPFTAEQYFTTNKPAFNWRTTIRPSSFLLMTGRDKYEDGKGHMLIKAYSLYPVVDAKGKETDQGSMLRYLAEICWFPSAALSNYIQWETVDSVSAKATMNYGGITASGVFTFNNDGDLLSFEADRYYVDNKNTTLEKWLISCKGYTVFNGIRIPSNCEVTWKLKEGDFTWLRLKITKVVYNNKLSHSNVPAGIIEDGTIK